MAQPRQRSALFWALWLSLLLHAVLLTLHFKPELKKLKDRLPTLEVMLVNSKTQQAPKKADVLAQANLDRGGNTDEKRSMKSPLPLTSRQPLFSAQVSAKDIHPDQALNKQESELEQEKQRVAKLEQEALALLTQLKAQQSLPSLQTAARKQNASAAAAMPELARLEALIAKQQEDYESRPKRQFIGARTQEYRFARYVEQWRQKIENVGNRNYPQAARAQGLYGQLQMTVSIRANGTIESVTINRSSGHKLLDEAAKRIVQLAAPFDVFDPDLRRDTDILSITRTWTFTHGDALFTE